MTFVQSGVFLLGILCYCIYAQNITSTTLRDGQVACADTDVTFTCETRGSSALAWRSDHFIGVGSTAQLIFSDVDNPGRMQSVSTTTVATLTKNEPMDGVQLLESTLRVRAPASSTTPLSVTCVHLENNVDRSVTFSVLSTPGAVVNAFSDQVQCVNSSMCLVISSWSSPMNVNTTNFTIYVNGTIISSSRDNFRVESSSEGPKFSYSSVVPTCYSHNVTISASNICGEGPPTSQTLQGPDNRIEPPVACDSGHVTTVTIADSTMTTNDSKGIKCFIGVAGAMLYGVVMLTVNSI